MKKLLTLTLIVLALVLALASCIDNPTTEVTVPSASSVHEHNYEATVTDPTCTKRGVVVYTCDCGYSYKEVIDALVHTESDWIIDLEPTTEIEGKKHVECTVCGTTLKTEAIEKIVVEILEFTLNEDGQSYSVTGIGSCTDTNIIIPDTYEGLPVTSIGNFAFRGHQSLTSITIGESVTSIGERAFSMCTSLKDVYYEGDLEGWLSIIFHTANSNPCYYEANLYFDGNLVTNIKIPSSVTKINSYAFSGCSSITSVVIPNTVTSIGDRIFFFCPELTIYCEAESQPSGWNSAWNDTRCPVVWGYKGE